LAYLLEVANGQIKSIRWVWRKLGKRRRPRRR
jgi:hypothetical protein